MTQTFLKIGSIVLPKERIGKINLDARKPGTNEAVIEVWIHGMQDPFVIDGQLASQAFDLLKDVKPTLFTICYPNITVLRNGISSYVKCITDDSGVCWPVNFKINNEWFNACDVEWVDLETNFGIDGIGVEMRIATDPVGQSRTFIGKQLAEEAFEAIVNLVNEGNSVPLVNYA